MCVRILIFVSRDADKSAYEDAARVRKVLRILSLVPHGETPAAVAAIADKLASFTPAQRTVFAARAQQKPPSDATWALLVATARKREPSAPFARAAGSHQ
jgi:hypothetical protein